MRSCGSGPESWNSRMWKFLTDQHPEKFSSHNLYLHCKALSTWLSKSGYLADFKNHIGEICFFDDPRLVTSNVIHLIHQWALAIQQYKQTSSTIKRLLLLEGCAFMIPSTTPESGKSESMSVSGREASRAGMYR